jgi:hypothetical protein
MASIDSSMILSKKDPRCVPLESSVKLLIGKEIPLLETRAMLMTAVRGCLLHPVKLTISFDESFFTESFYQDNLDNIITDDDLLDEEETEKINESIKQENVFKNPLEFIHTPISNDFQKVIIQSNLIGLHEPREEYDFTLEDFRWEITRTESKETITFLDIVEGIYRVKGAKYDHWRELLCYLELRKVDETLYVFPEFDHGS